MSRTTKAERELEAEHQKRLHQSAQRGVAHVRQELEHSRKVVARLIQPVDMGRRHGHGEPFEQRGCGWCGNVRTWRGLVAFYAEALPLAQYVEREVLNLAALPFSQAALCQKVQERFPYVTRARVRELRRRVRP